MIGYAIALLVAALFIGFALYALFEGRPVRSRRIEERPGFLPDEAVRRFMDEDKRF